MILDEQELEEIRQDIAEIYAEVMSDLLNIQRTDAVTRDAENPEVFTENVNLVYTDVPCTYRSMTPYERNTIGKTESFQLLMVDVAAVYDIRPSDAGVILAKGTTGEIPFEVVVVIRSANQYSLTLVVEVK